MSYSWHDSYQQGVPKEIDENEFKSIVDVWTFRFEALCLLAC